MMNLWTQKYSSNKVLILARTKMGNGCCAGAYDIQNRRMIRLLDNHGHNLMDTAPYKVGQIYSLDYADKYQLSKPHMEDVAVYQSRHIGDCEYTNFYKLMKRLANKVGAVNDLFGSKVKQDGNHFCVDPASPSDYSVQLALLDVPFEKRPRYKDETKWDFYVVGSSMRIPYVGEKDAGKLPNRTGPGDIIRFSLTRPWSPSPETKPKVCNLQISDIYSPEN